MTEAPPEIELGDEAPTALYRFYSADDSLLYVGITNSIKARLAQHAADKPWWPEVARKTVTWHTTRADALAAELAAIRGEHPLHNIAGKAAPRRLRAVEDWDGGDGYGGDAPPGVWAADYWGRIWWNSERGSNAAQYEFLDIFGCPPRNGMDALGIWYRENRDCRTDGSGWPAVWHQADYARPAELEADPRQQYTYSIHADVTCVDPIWEKFTPDVARVQEEFLHALLAAGRCRSVHPGRAAAAFGFTDQLEAQIAGTILGYLTWGGTDVAIQSTEALLLTVAA